MKNIYLLLALVLLITACEPQPRITPLLSTEPVTYDSDDPAIWVNPNDPAKSLIIGTDKNADGALYVFDLQGKIIANKVVKGLERPNNVDLGYNLPLGKDTVDFVVTTGS